MMLPTAKRSLALAILICCLVSGLVLPQFVRFGVSEPLARASDHRKEHNVTLLGPLLTRDDRCNGPTDIDFLREHNSTAKVALILGLLDAYRVRHKSWKVALLRGEDTIRTLTWTCYTLCGGIGDRVKGIATSLLLAALTDRLLLIGWSTPFDPKQQRLLFQPAAIDWDVDGSVMSAVQHPEDVHMMTTSDVKWIAQALQGTVFNDSVQHVVVRTNVHYRTIFLGLPDLDSSALDVLYEKRLNHQMLEELQGRRYEMISGLLVRYLFHFSNTLLTRIGGMRKVLGLQNRPYVGVHLRTGFFGTLNESPERYGAFQHKKVWQQLLDCAIEKGEASLGSEVPVVMLTDSMAVKGWAINRYKERLLLTTKAAIHFDKLEDSDATIDATLQAGAEMGILAYSSILFVSTTSGFSRVAREYCGIPENRVHNGLSCHH